jgi:transposase
MFFYMNIKQFFKKPNGLLQRRYEALRLHYVDGVSLSKAADKYKLSLSYLSSERTKVSRLIKEGIDPFFIEKKSGPKSCYKTDPVKDKIIDLRLQNFSILDIKSSLEGCGIRLSHDTIYEVIKNEGFSRLPRRSYQEKSHLPVPKKIQPPRSSQLFLEDEKFSTCRSGAFLSFLPLIEDLGIITAIQNAGFPETKDISAVSYVLSFLVLKLIGNQRLSHDESWSLDRALGLFAGLNVLPKSSSLSSYSYRISRECNRRLLVELNKIFNTADPSRCEFNLDFKTIPHWGDESILERNYSTTRGKAVKSVLALIVQNISSSNIAYTNAETTHDNEKDSVLEFVDFWKESTGQCPKMLIFDSQFTIHENLSKLDDDGIKFLTLRRRTEKMLAHAAALSKEAWTIIEVDAGKRKPRQVRVYDEIITLPKYKKTIRQLIIIDHSKEPVFMLTNDQESTPAILIRKYGRRWLVEQEIAEQIAFFHLNQLSSSIVVKVDFDLTMTVLAHNLYRILGSKIHRHENSTAATLHRRFIEGRAFVDINKSDVMITLTKRAHSPLLFEVPWMNKKTKLSWHGFKVGFQIGATS